MSYKHVKKRKPANVIIHGNDPQKHAARKAMGAKLYVEMFLAERKWYRFLAVEAREFLEDNPTAEDRAYHEALIAYDQAIEDFINAAVEKDDDLDKYLERQGQAMEHLASFFGPVHKRRNSPLLAMITSNDDK